jgi:hypothetical protein
MKVWLVPLDPALEAMSRAVQGALESASPLRSVAFQQQPPPQAWWRAHKAERGTDLAKSPAVAVELGRELHKHLKLGGNDALVLLTRERLAGNWFSFHDGPSPATVVVHATGWESLGLDEQAHFAVAHLVASNLMATQLFPRMHDWRRVAHQATRGCVMDLCMNKREIEAKLKAADICPACHDAFAEVLSGHPERVPVFRHCMEMIAGLRSHFINAKLQAFAAFQGRIDLRCVPGTRGRSVHVLHVPELGLNVLLSEQELSLYLLAVLTDRSITYHRMNRRLFERWEALYVELKPWGRDLSRTMCREENEGPAAERRGQSAFGTTASNIRTKFKAALGHQHALLFVNEPTAHSPGLSVPLGLRSQLTSSCINLKNFS